MCLYSENTGLNNSRYLLERTCDYRNTFFQVSFKKMKLVRRHKNHLEIVCDVRSRDMH